MKAMVEQMYDYYIRPYLGEKGQDLIEYALLLAIVVGIGYLIYKTSGIADNLETVFKEAGSLAQAASQEAVKNKGT